MLTRKNVSTFCLCILFWFITAWGTALRDHARSRAEYAAAGMVAALLLVVLGSILLKIASKLGSNHEATRDTSRFALIVLATGIVCGLVALGFRWLKK